MLVGCSTAAPADLAFRPESRRAFLVVASAPTAAQAMHVFRKVNLTTGKFEGDVIKVTTGVFGGTGRINANDPTSRVFLAVTEASPGDYAQVETSYTVGGLATTTRWHCFNKAAPVYSLSPGRITVVRADDAVSPEMVAAARAGGTGSVTDANVLDEFARARASYPSVSGEAVLTKYEAIIRYEDALPVILQLDAIFTNVRECGQPAKFTIVQ